jgi:hypothetical protein
MTAPSGFSYRTRGEGTVVISHRGRTATTLRGAKAAEFLDEVASGDPQMVMARWTGSYKMGNERIAKNHPRNRHRR